MKTKIISYILFCLIGLGIWFFPHVAFAQTLQNTQAPLELTFPPALLLGQEKPKDIQYNHSADVKLWKLPLNEAILDFLGQQFATPTTKQPIQQITKIVQPASNIANNVSIRNSSNSDYNVVLQIDNLTDNQVITFPDESGEVTLLGQIIPGSHIADKTIDLLTKTTGNYVASLVGGNGLHIVSDLMQAATPSVSLGDLTQDWIQSGPYNLILNNPQSKLKIIDSSGTHFATFDVGSLGSDVTYTISGTAGTLLTSSNYGNFLSGLGTGDMLAVNNLSELTNFANARTNLGLGSAAIKNVSDFLQTASNLSDLANAVSARGNLGLGSIATQSSASVFQVTNNLSEITSPLTARNNLGLGSVATQSATAVLQVVNNLADLPNLTTARGNLGLGTAAVQNVGAFLQTGNNLSDLNNSTLARTNLGLGSIATQNIGSFLQGGNNLSDLTNPVTGRLNLGLGTLATQSAGNVFLSGGSLSGVIIPASLNTISGLTPISFASANISQWTNNTGFITPSTSDTLMNKVLSAATNTISSLSTTNFSSTNISQWNNDTGFITASTTDILTNKTLTSPTINGTIGTTGLTLPAFTANGNISGSGSPTLSNFGAINGLTLTAAADGMTIAGGTTSRTLTLIGGNLTLGNVIKPTNTGSLTIQSNGTNPLNLDSGATINIGTGSATGIAVGTDATISANKTFSVATADKLLVGGNIIPQTVTIPVPLGLSLITSQIIFVSDNTYKISGVQCAYSVRALVGGTLQVTVDTGTTAPGGGTNQLSSTINLSGTLNSVLSGSLIGNPTTINPGDRLGISFGGTLTGLLGNCTVTLKRV